MNIQGLLDYIKENKPGPVRLPYKYILLPVLAFVLAVLSFSVIRSPKLIQPSIDGASIPVNPVIRFSVVKNALYKDFEVEMFYNEREIPLRVSEEGGVVTAIPERILPRRAEVKLEITIKKGIWFIPLWDKTFTYTFTTVAP